MSKFYVRKLLLLACAVLLHITGAVAQTVTVGSTTGSTSYFYGPYYRSSTGSSFNYSRYGYLYTATELNIPPGSTITQIEWYKASGTITGNNTFDILLDNSSAATLPQSSSWGTLTATATPVYNSTTQSFTAAANSWESFPLTATFTYTGGSLLIFTNHVKSGTAAGANNYYVNTATNLAVGYASGSAATSSTLLTTNGGYGDNRPTIRITYVPGVACNSMPSAGTIVASSTNVCPNQTFSLTLSGATAASGLAYQWEESPVGANSWTPVGTNASYSGTMTASRDYHCIVTCTATSQSATTPTITVNKSSYINCYCASAAVNTGDGEIFNVTYGQLNNSSTCSQTGTTGSILNRYSNYTNLTPDTIYQDQPYVFSVNAAACGTGAYPGWVKAWIDLDTTGDFVTTGEEIFSMAPPGGNYTPAGVITSGLVTIPSATFPLVGLTRMRVILMESGSATLTTPCSNSNYGYGETEDYLVYMAGVAPSCNTVTAGTVSKNKDSVCNNESFTLSATGYTVTGAGLQYEWESSPAGMNSWTTLSGATTPTYIGSQTGPTDYRFKVTCTNSSLSATSAPVTLTTAASYVCYCSPKTGTTLSTCCGNYISNVTISSTTMNNSSTTYGPGYYTQYFPNVASQTASLAQGVTYNISVDITYSGSNYGAEGWIDFDGSGTFDAGEHFNLGVGTSSTIVSLPVTVPATTFTGNTGMRIRHYWSTPAGPSGACLNYSNNYETEDYVVNILPPPSCVPPSALNASNLLATSADIGWTSTTSATQWQVEYGITPFTIGTGTRVTTSTNPYSVSGLQPSTSYTYHVRDICGPNDTSSWSSASFITPCAPVSTFPWNENFDALATVGNVNFPNCWTKENGDWSTSNSANSSPYAVPLSGSNFLRNSWSATNEYMWTPGFQLTANTSYDLSYYVAGDGATGWVVDVFQNSAPASSGSTQVGGSYNIPATTCCSAQPYVKQTQTFVPTTSGVYYFGIRVNQPSGAPWYVAFDDFRVEVTPTCPSPSSVTATSPTTTSLTIGWASNTTATQYQIEYTPGTSFTVGTGTRVGPTGVTNPQTVTGLTQGAPYTFYVREICGPNDTSSWSPALTAFTAFPAVPANDDCVNAVNISNGAIYYGSNAGATQSMAACDATATATDVWYTFTTGATAGVVSDSVNTSFSGGDVVVQMFGGTCTSLTPLVPTAGTTYNTTNGCVDGPAAGMEWSTYSLAANTTYFIRVYAYNTTTPGPFSIRVTGAPLAIRLDKISAANAGAANRIDWNTVSEERGDKFELQRSIDGKNFATIYGTDANGVASRYTYLDKDALKGMNYYRLRMSAADGSATYSETVSAFVKSTGFEVEAFPNPVSHELTVKVTGVQGADATVQVTDVTGKVIRTVKMNTNLETIDMTGLANGIYLIKYSDATHAQTIKVNKQ